VMVPDSRAALVVGEAWALDPMASAVGKVLGGAVRGIG